MASSRRSLLGESRFALIAPVVALVAYLPAIVVPYAFMDDYFVLAWREGLGGEFFKTATSFGRPLHAVFLRGAFSLATDIDSLRLVRLLSLVGVMTLAVLLYHALRQAGFGPWFSTGVCVSVVSLASFQVYVSWASCSEASYAAILGGLAWLRLRSAFELSGRGALIRRAEAAALLLCALLVYQPTAMFFWVFAAIDALRPSEQIGQAWRKLAAGLGVAAVAMFFAYAAVRVGVHFYGGATSGRTNLVHDFIGKARWFWNEPIVNSFGMSGLVPTETLALALAALAAVGILLLHAESGWGALGFLGLAVALIPLSYLPNLAVAEQFASYRSIGALATLLTIYVWLGLCGIARFLLGSEALPRVGLGAARMVALALAALLSFVLLAGTFVPLAQVLRSAQAARASSGLLTSWQGLVAFGLLLVVFAGLALLVTRSSAQRARTPVIAAGVLAVSAFVFTGVLVAARDVTTLVVKPQSAEVQLLRSALHNPGVPAPGRVVFVKPSSSQGAAPLVRYDEFGPPSTYFPWVPNPAVLLVLRERLQRPQPEIEVLAWDQAPATRRAPGDAFVDMRDLRQRRVGWQLWTLEAASTAMPTGAGPSARRR
ncbi:MAG: hypothetical protein QOE13_460 [Gaiellaceae bacterium]|nr:hypothetical protein [Gaiellaceae bacterium]